ncbi:hypothetical protein CsSME_00025568 [Camellia sinensis var. sinensis]
MVGIFSRFSVNRNIHRRTQSAIDEREFLPSNSEVPGAATVITGAAVTAAHGIEVAVEFKPLEHPTEPLDNDRPILCPIRREERDEEYPPPAPPSFDGPPPPHPPSYYEPPPPTVYGGGPGEPYQLLGLSPKQRVLSLSLSVTARSSLPAPITPILSSTGSTMSRSVHE